MSTIATVDEAVKKLLARRDEIILAANIQLAENEAALRLLGWEPEEKNSPQNTQSAQSFNSKDQKP